MGEEEEIWDAEVVNWDTAAAIGDTVAVIGTRRG